MQPVLVIQLARFGDLVQTKRLLRSLLAEPDAEVHLCLDESLAALARLLYPGVLLHPLAAHGTALAKLPPAERARELLARNVPAFRELASIPFGRVYTLNFSPLNFRVAALFDPDRVRGHVWRSGQEEVGQWARLAMRWSSLRRIGLNIADFWAWHHPSPIAPELVNPAASGRGGGLGVVLAGRESRRSLPPKVLGALVAGLMDLRGYKKLTLLGSASEAQAARLLLRELPERHAARARDLCGKTGWGELIAAVDGLDLLLTPDTGTMHLAAHLGVPVLASFLSSAWCFETGPYGAGHTVLQSVLDCLPCLESQPCPLDVECLKPFTGPGLLRFLATGDPAKGPEGLAVYASECDALGASFRLQAGSDPLAETRGRFRTFLARHLGLGGSWTDLAVHDLAERLYAEPDWQAPDQEAAHARLRTGTINFGPGM